VRLTCPKTFRACPSLNDERQFRAPSSPSANCGDPAESIGEFN